MAEGKNYINGIVIKEKSFDNGGTQLKVSIKLDEFIEQLKECDQDESYKGWVNCIISRRLEPSDKGVTHYMHEDTWKPNPSYKSNSSNHVTELLEPILREHKAVKDDLPF
jgi:hypothetical protein